MNLKWVKIGVVQLVVLFCLGEFGFTQTTKEPEKKYPKNIILMIGDGMGVGQITAAMYASQRQLNIEQFEVVGFQKTHSAQYLYTDSAAGATAMACGKKTLIGAIGLDEKKRPCKSILELAEESGLATGLVATSTIVHATPASFVAHAENRGMYEIIAAQIANADVDILIGGGQKFFEARAMDDENLSDKMRKRGYVVTSFVDKDLSDIVVDYQKNFVHYTAATDPLPVSQGRSYLPYASKLATAFLDKRTDNGFFLMIEGSQIDWGGHNNLGDFVVSEVIDFDEAIGEVLEFAAKDGETLVIVTADHETGGLAINPGSKTKHLKLKFTSNKHTCTMVPVFAYGPQAEQFSGIFDNTELFQKMKAALRLSASDAAAEGNAQLSAKQ